MSIEHLLSELRAQGFRLWTDNARLFFRAPPGQMTTKLRDRIKQHKSALIQLLSSAELPSLTPQSDIGRSQQETALLSFAQQRLWFLEQLEPGTGTYNIPAAFSLVGDLQVPALEAALNRVVQRHEGIAHDICDERRAATTGGAAYVECSNCARKLDWYQDVRAQDSAASAGSR